MCHRLKMKQQGIATLVVAMVLMVVSATTLLVLGERLSLEHKVNSNEYRAMQAFNAAEAGLEYGLEYLSENKDLIILDIDTNGVLDPFSSASTQNVTLADGSSYSVSFSNPIANNFDLIQITATGISSDNTTTRVVRQLTQYSTFATKNADSPVIAKGSVLIEGNPEINNPQYLTSVKTGAGATLTGSAETNATDGVTSYSSSAGSIGADIQQNLPELTNITDAELFEQYFGMPKSSVQDMADYSYEGSGNYSADLSGKTASIIWIDKTAGEESLSVNIRGPITIGSADNPVVLIVNGDLSITGTVDFYGVIYASGNADIGASGTPRIYGTVVTSGTYTMHGTAQVNYNDSYLSEFNKTIYQFNKIPGSWIDY